MFIYQNCFSYTQPFFFCLKAFYRKLPFKMPYRCQFKGTLSILEKIQSVECNMSDIYFSQPTRFRYFFTLTMSKKMNHFIFFVNLPFHFSSTYSSYINTKYESATLEKNIWQKVKKNKQNLIRLENFDICIGFHFLLGRLDTSL